MMVQIEDKIISLDVFDRQFACDLSACRGACCVDGDAGAPLNDDELSVLSEIFDELKPYMRQEGIDTIKEQGYYVVDSDGDNTTPLINNNECAFVSFVDGVAEVDKAAGGKYKTQTLPARPAEARETQADITKTTKNLGWTPKKMLKDWINEQFLQKVETLQQN